MADNSSGSFIGGMIIGVALGALGGLLAAPRSGRETRKLLKKSADALPELAEDLSTTIQMQADRLSETALRNWEDTLERLQQAIAAGEAASRQEYDKLHQPEPPLASGTPVHD